MPIFGEASTPYDEAVEKVTLETCTSENWALILDICDRVSSELSKGSAKQALLSVKKRLSHRDPHVVLLALSLLDSLWANCGAPFRREVSSREFTSELLSKATHSNRAIAEKTKELIAKWVENECVKDASLSLMDTLYNELKRDGHSFPSTQPKKIPEQFPTDPNVVCSAEEEEAIAKAIALSLKDPETTRATTHSTSSVYPSALLSASNQNAMRTVRALYDFEAVEDNELTFCAGDVVSVLDDSDANWWKGRSHRGVGLFPASFVAEMDERRKTVQFDEQVAVVQSPPRPPSPHIDETVLRRCLEMLEDADPTGEVADPGDLQVLEESALSQAPLIDARLAHVDRQHNLLAEVDVKIRDVLALYDSAVQQVSMHYQMQQVNYGPPASGAMPANATWPQPAMYSQQGNSFPAAANAMQAPPGQQPFSSIQQ